MSKVTRSEAVANALIKAGIIADMRNVARVLIDIRSGGTPYIYVQQFVPADEEMRVVMDAVLSDMGPETLVAPEVPTPDEQQH